MSLQRVLDVCECYARTLRFQFNARKSCVLQVYPSMRDQPLPFNWTIGRKHIPQARGYTHQGIELNSKLNSSERTNKSCPKGRN